MSFLDATANEDEFWRLVNVLRKTPGTWLATVAAGWDMPVSGESFFIASIYTAVIGKPHPLIPGGGTRGPTEVEIQFADRALENMNRS